jgi:hypothetical protein
MVSRDSYSYTNKGNNLKKMIKYVLIKMNWDSSVSKVTGYWVDDRGYIPDKGRISCLVSTVGERSRPSFAGVKNLKSSTSAPPLAVLRKRDNLIFLTFYCSNVVNLICYFVTVQ